jgi:hypothetical protein
MKKIKIVTDVGDNFNVLENVKDLLDEIKEGEGIELDTALELQIIQGRRYQLGGTSIRRVGNKIVLLKTHSKT